VSPKKPPKSPLRRFRLGRFLVRAAVFACRCPNRCSAPTIGKPTGPHLPTISPFRQPGRRSEIGAERTKPGTVAAGFVVYTGSASFKNDLAPSTQSVHFNILQRLRDQWGDRRLKQLQRRHVISGSVSAPRRQPRRKSS
jgi:hypothetical protein